MKLSQVVAWITCLVVAFLALLVSIDSRLKAAVVEQRVGAVDTLTAEQTALLEEVRDLLRQMRDQQSPSATERAPTSEP